MPCHRFMNHSNFIKFSCNSVSFQSFRPSPALLSHLMSEHPTLQSFFSAALHTQPQLDHIEDTLLGIGDYLSENAHPQHVAVEAARNNLRVVRRTLKFLMAVQLREATRSMQMYLMNTGHLPALDMEFQDE